MMKKCGTDIIQVPKQCEEAAPKFIIPNLKRQKFNHGIGHNHLGLKVSLGSLYIETPTLALTMWPTMTLNC